jgi:hypothetical protein
VNEVAMTKRLLAAVLLMILTSAIAHAAARVPQIPVSGSALSTFFASQGQTIDVNNQQLDLQSLSVPATTNFEVRVFGPAASTTAFGAYNTAPASPPLYLIAPGAASPGWFQVAGFRTGPSRLVVNEFDAGNTFQGTNSYIGADPTGFGFYDQGATATFFTQDSRNTGGAAKILAYNGTGSRVGWTWFACETGASPGGDYADFIALVNLSLAPVPVNRTDWGTLKRRFQ